MSEYVHRDAAREAASEADEAPDIDQRAASFAEANYHATMAVYEILTTINDSLENLNLSVLAVHDAVNASN